MTDAEHVVGEFVVCNAAGLHARAAARLAATATAYESHIEVEKDGRRVDAKSIMGLLLLCGQRGTVLRIHAEGHDATAALTAVGQLIESRFGEEV
ncbi:MAG: HPr family phosphocarrier protein [Polyangiales bacterium]